MAIKHAVWPVGRPSIPTDEWTQQIWQNYENRFRPADYRGSIYDRVAWDRYLAMRQERLFEIQMGVLT